jgi:quinol monooxygenase YgiN
MFQEQFKDQAAFDFHGQQPHFQALIANLDGLLEAEPEIRFYQEL